MSKLAGVKLWLRPGVFLVVIMRRWLGILIARRCVRHCCGGLQSARMQQDRSVLLGISST